jgi:RluA family pseudouridine synthase
MTQKPSASMEAITLTTKIEHKSSQTLLEFLSKRFHYHNPKEWAERIQDGRVLVNGIQASKGQPLRAGDEIAYTTPAWEEPEVRKDYRVVYEDKFLLVLSKPAPLPVHAIGNYFRHTLMHLLREDRPEAADYHLAHRLDAETSGLLMLAKDKNLIPLLQKQWEREVHKTYQAIVFGKFPREVRRFEAPIGFNPESQVRLKSRVDRAQGKPAVTDFHLLESRRGFSLLEAKLVTGRTHQIRIHLEHLGHSIVGDKIYSGSDKTFLHFLENGWDDWLKERVILPRMALHAFKLEFLHPVTGERVVLEDPLPEDLTSFWKNI